MEQIIVVKLRKNLIKGLNLKQLFFVSVDVIVKLIKSVLKE